LKQQGVEGCTRYELALGHGVMDDRMCAKIVLELGGLAEKMGDRPRGLSAHVVACCGLVWPIVLASLGTENPRVGGSIPP
jgi:hypothetical protein